MTLKAFLRKIGVKYQDGMHYPIFEEDYIKFMSSSLGELDVTACDQFEVWLKAHGYSYERHRDRAIRSLDLRAVKYMQAFWEKLPG